MHWPLQRLPATGNTSAGSVFNTSHKTHNVSKIYLAFTYLVSKSQIATYIPKVIKAVAYLLQLLSASLYISKRGAY